LDLVLLLFEVDKVLVVLEDADVGEGAPGPLDLLDCYHLFAFSGDLLLALKEPSPGPLNLDRRDVVHRETMVLEQTPRQGHLVGRLDQSRTEVPPALLLTLVELVEGRSEELGSKFLGRGQMLQLAHIAELVDPDTTYSSLHFRACSSFDLLMKLPLHESVSGMISHWKSPLELSLPVEVVPDEVLYLDGRQMLSSHRLAPRLLDDPLHHKPTMTTLRRNLPSSHSCSFADSTESSSSSFVLFSS